MESYEALLLETEDNVKISILRAINEALGNRKIKMKAIRDAADDVQYENVLLKKITKEIETLMDYTSKNEIRKVKKQKKDVDESQGSRS